MKRIALFALLGMLTTVVALADAPVTMTITFKNNAVVTHNAADYDSVRYVGGQLGDAGAVGLKIYKAGRSTDYLYSQILTIVTSVDVTTPVISPDGGTITSATTVTITSGGGTTIYYTLDGTAPTTSSPLNGPSPVTIVVSESVTLKAIAAFGSEVSEVATAVFERSTVFDNNINRNGLSANYSRVTATYESDANHYIAWHLEFPRISDTGSNTWVVHEEDGDLYGNNYSLEWSNDDIANRWTCYQFSDKNNKNNCKRTDSFKADPALPTATRSELDDYSDSGYSRGHLCPSADRRMSTNQNKTTCFLSNMQPQESSHNSGLWANLEATVNGWGGSFNTNGSKSTKTTMVGDTLYIVKAATISETVDLSSVHADSVAVKGIYYKSNGSKLLCNNRLPVPKYFYMAVLSYTKSSSDTGDGTYHGTFKAIGLWTRHWDTKNFEVITIDELEKRTGLDFFCNLPDDVEAAVEATVDKSFWGMSAY